MSQTAQIAQGVRLGAAGALLRFPARRFVSAMLDRVIPRLHLDPDRAEGPGSSLKKTTMLNLAVATHSIPEGMAVGVVSGRCFSPLVSRG